MAYVFGLPRDVTDLIYSFRDPLNWNGDKYRSTPLGALFKSGHLEIIREPLAPYFQYWRGVIYQIEDFPDDFFDPPNITVWERVRGSAFCHAEFTSVLSRANTVWLRDDVVLTISARIRLNLNADP